MLKRTVVWLVKLLLFVAVVWLVVAAYWKYTDHVVSSEDLLIYFLFLPIALLLGYLLIRFLWWASKKTFRRFRAPAATSASAISAAHAGVGADGSRAELSRPAYVIATAMSTYFGDEGELFLNATLQDKKRAEIDEEITQELGYGVRVARVDQIELAPVQAGVRMTMLRTRALLQKAYEELEGVLRRAAPSAESMGGLNTNHMGVQLHPEWREKPGQQGVSSVVAAPQAVPGSMPTGLSVHIVLPVFLTAPEASLIQTEVLEWLQASDWPLPVVKALTIQPENEVDYLRRLQAWLQPTSIDAATNEWLLVLTAISWLDVELLKDRLSKDTRFEERLTKGGTVVGELACGVVLAKTPPDAQLQLEPLARLTRFTLAQRTKPVDAKGAIEAEMLTEMLADQTLVLNEKDKQFVGLAASGDLNNGSAIELGRWVTNSLPQLHFIDDVLCVAEHMGECEPGGSLLALALAAAMARQREGTVIYCANQHASWRALATIMPVA